MIEHKSSGRNLRRLLGDQPCPKTTRESDLLSLLAEAGPPESEVGFWSEAHVKTPYNLQCILNDFNLSPTPFDKEPFLMSIALLPCPKFSKLDLRVPDG